VLAERRELEPEIDLAALYRRQESALLPVRPLDRLPTRDKVMPNEYRTGPIYRAGLLVTGGMCAGLGIVVLLALALHRAFYAQLLPASVPTSPIAAIGFAACGFALIGIGCWFPRITSVLSMVTLSMVIALLAERALAMGPRVEAVIGANFEAGGFSCVAPNTMLVLLLAAAALLLRHTARWFDNRLWMIGVLGSIIFAIGAVACVGYLTGIPSYIWQPQAPMSFLSGICSSMLGLGIVMSACRYSELDELGTPRWFGLVVCTGALAINFATGLAYWCNNGHDWSHLGVLGLMPMMVVSATLSAVAARQAWLWAVETAIENRQG